MKRTENVTMMKLVSALLLMAAPAFSAFPDICEKCWYEVPNSNMDTVSPSPTPPGWSGPDARMGNNGGAFDTRRNRLIVTGGGGRDYSGNEVYAFDLDSLKWYRIKDGAEEYDQEDSLYAYYLNGGVLPDSQQPRPGFNYDQIEYDSTTDNLFILGAPFASWNGTQWKNIFQLNMGTMTWSHPTDINSGFYGGNVSARDPLTGKIWFYGNAGNGWTQSFNPGTGVLSDHGNMWTGGWIGGYQNASIMPSTNRMIAIGGGHATYWDIVASGESAPTALETTGCDSLLAIDDPGFEWDPVQRKLVGWARGTHVITMDSTYTCEDIAPSDSNTVTPTPPIEWGTYGRWRYVPKYNVFIVVNSTSTNVFLYRPTAGTGTVSQVVEITSPTENFLTNLGSIPVNWKVGGVVQGTGTTETLGTEGANPIVRCSGGACDTVTVFRDQTPPVIVITNPGDTTISTDLIEVAFTADANPRTRVFHLDPGLNIVVVDTLDAAGNRGADSIEVTYTVPTGVPIWPSWSQLSVTDVQSSSLKISWTPAVDDSGVSQYRIYREAVLIDSVPGNQMVYTDVGLFWNHSHSYKVEAGDLRGNWSTNGPDSAFATSDQLPPNPEDIASVLDNTVATTLFAGAEFLFNDTLPIQTGMAPEIIDTLRASVLRGTVSDKNGDPLPGVSISVLGAKAFGSTVTREDGEYDMMINGGGLVTLKMSKFGYLPVQRQMEIPWRGYVTFPEISLLQLDSVFQVISLDSSGPMQVFRAGVVSDGDGPRQATLLIPEYTSGQKVFPDGSTQPLESITVRATEYTVGENGQKSMPADLPHTSGYTYAVEYSADEALEEGTGIQFNQPIVAYLEDFVGIPVGWSVPSAYYDRKKGQWIPEQDGRVVRIQSISAGMANLEIEEGGSLADSAELVALGITEAEREKLAILYAAGDSLWRVGIRHFTPYDYNFGTVIFSGGKPKVKAKNDNETDEDDKECGSVIGCQTQTLGESFPIVGTPFTMHYSSSRAKGRKANFVQKILLTDSALPVGIETVRLALSIAGRSWTYNFAPDTNLSFTFEWDGLDGYGREVQGKQALVYSIGYGYTASYIRPPFMAASFGNGQLDPNAPPIVTRARRYDKTSYTTYMGIWSNRPQKMGEWSINIHHNYDVSGKNLHFGNGDQKKATDFGNRLTISTVAGNGVAGFSGDNGPARNAKLFAPYDIDIAPDGSIYVFDLGNYRIRKINPDGVITTVAGNGTRGYSGDGGLAIDAEIEGGHYLEIAPDGSLYFSDFLNHCIRKVDTQGIITTVIGTGVEGFSGDGGPANMAKISLPSDIVISPDGAIYFGDFLNMRVRKVGTDGIVHTILGNGDGFIADTDSVPALSVGCYPFSLDLDSDGNLYIADQANLSLFKVSPDGFFTKVAGNGTYLATGDGGLAVEAGIQPVAVKVVEGENGVEILVSDRTHQKFSVRKIDPQGYISTILGGTDIDYDSIVLDKEYGPLTQKGLFVEGIAIGSNGEIYITDSYTHRIRRIDSYLPSFENEVFSIPSQDGREIYSFNSFGLHLKTLDGLTGKALFSFEYDNSGVLSAIIDANGNETSIERNELGHIEKIVSPYGQETFFNLDDSGYIAKVTNPAGEERRYEYTQNGLLTGYLTPRNNLHEYDYDSLGLLKRDDDPAGGYKELSRTETSDGTLSSLVTALGRKKSYLMEKLTTGVARKVNTDPAGLATETTFGTNGQISVLNPDSSKIEVWQAPDPRFGMLSPYPESTIVTLPSGQKSIATRRMGATFANPSDPLTLQTLSDTMVINGRVFTQEYESETRTQTMIGPEGRTVKRAMDSLGRVTGERVGGLNTVRYSYDAQGRLDSLIRGTGPGARRMALEYDELGNLSNLTDELNRVFGYEYDAAGRRTKAILPDSQEVSFAYDSSGNLISVTPSGKPTHSFGFNSVDLPSEYTPPSLGAGRWATGKGYNLDKQVERIVRPESTQIEFEYDSAGRVSTVQIPDATIRYSYDGSTGMVDSILSRDSIFNAYEFDGSLLTKETLSGPIDGEIAFRYNSDFRVDSLGVNGTFVGFDYDQDGLLIQAGGLSLAYGTENSLLRKATFAGLKDTLAYNGFGELIRQSDSGASGLKYAATFQRDKLGRILEKLETVTGTTTRFSYDYDAQGRLVQVLVDSAFYSRYHYDGNGNRLARVVPGDSMVGAYDNQDRLSHYGSLTYLYTSNGDLSATVWGSDTTRYAYDVLGNLLSVQMPGGPLIEYLIDGKNRKVGKKVNGTLVQGFLYQNQLKPVAELDGSGTVVSRFVYASKVNVPDLVIKGGVTYRIISDYLGSPRLVINTLNDSVVQRMDYDEFGNLLQNTNPGFQPFGFAGGIYDSHTALSRFGARDYSSWNGRWSKKDPIGFLGGDLNLFAYASNDPVNNIDVNGMDAGAAGKDAGSVIRCQGHVIEFPPGTSIDDNISISRFISLPTWIMAEYKDGTWDYNNNLGIKYEEFGNFNYGATGTIMGFGEWELLIAAGVVQHLTNTARPEWGNPLKGPPYGDDPLDQKDISLGISYVKGQCGCN